MKNKNSSKRIEIWLFFTCLAVSSCSNEHDREMAENINLEFELTYQYVVENMPIKSNYSKNFSIFKKNNKDAFTSIAYTWHSKSLDACELANGNIDESNKTSYERMIQNSTTNSHLSKTILDSERPCLANIYFDNWSNIQNMLSLSYPGIN